MINIMVDIVEMNATESKTISALRTARIKIQTPTSIFLMSSSPMTLSPVQPEVALYQKYIWWPPKSEVTLSQHIGLVARRIYFR